MPVRWCKVSLLAPALDAYCKGAEPGTLPFNYRVGFALICEPEISTGIVFGVCAILAATDQRNFFLASLVCAHNLTKGCGIEGVADLIPLRHRRFSIFSYCPGS